MTPDYRDLALAHLAADEHALRVELVETRADRDAYRLLAQQAIEALHHLTRERDRLRAAHYELIDQYRALRAHTQEAA